MSIRTLDVSRRIYEAALKVFRLDFVFWPFSSDLSRSLAGPDSGGQLRNTSWLIQPLSRLQVSGNIATGLGSGKQRQ